MKIFFDLLVDLEQNGAGKNTLCGLDCEVEDENFESSTQDLLISYFQHSVPEIMITEISENFQAKTQIKPFMQFKVKILKPLILGCKEWNKILDNKQLRSNLLLLGVKNKQYLDLQIKIKQ